VATEAVEPLRNLACGSVVEPLNAGAHDWLVWTGVRFEELDPEPDPVLLLGCAVPELAAVLPDCVAPEPVSLDAVVDEVDDVAAATVAWRFVAAVERAGSWPVARRVKTTAHTTMNRVSATVAMRRRSLRMCARRAPRRALASSALTRREGDGPGRAGGTGSGSAALGVDIGIPRLADFVTGGAGVVADTPSIDGAPLSAVSRC
jgi:hypothetical protein